MSAIMHSDPATEKTHAEKLYESQLQKSRQFNMWVSITWGGLFLFLVYLFSGKSFLGFETIELNLEFVRKNFLFIAEGLGQTLLVSFLSITLAIFLALFAEYRVQRTNLCRSLARNNSGYLRNDISMMDMTLGIVTNRGI